MPKLGYMVGHSGYEQQGGMFIGNYSKVQNVGAQNVTKK